jgi:hypothetical protein
VFTTPGGSIVEGGVGMCVNASGQAIPTGPGCSSSSPCSQTSPNTKPISVTSATTVVIVAGSAGKKTYVCNISVSTGAADNVALVEGSGTTCGTSTLGLAGGTTAANGWNLAANGGANLSGGLNHVAQTTVNANDVCLITSSAGPLAGTIVYVQQ